MYVCMFVRARVCVCVTVCLCVCVCLSVWMFVCQPGVLFENLQG